MVDDVTQECLAAIPDTSHSGRRVAPELTALIEGRGKPGMIVSDNATQMTSNAILTFAAAHRIEWHYIAPGKPAQMGFVESFKAPSAMICSMARSYHVTRVPDPD
ncbi:hypothetical protein GCM10011415_14630 [Salipiger pallidus]|uniref:Integrase catalytic domain-containing protein n=1 Tax=Salipiger pallidus TaxID=1775170 RepID=A0A8J2ZIP6_9RHOB|nr:hypothetical protein GCM10011415_14630 [Salipiger pallidus]